MTRRPQRPTDGRRKGGKGRSAKTAARRAEPVSKSKTLTGQLKPKQSPEAAHAEMMVEGLGTNAVTATSYSKMLGDLDLAECMVALIAETRRVVSGDMGGPETMLAAQAVTLNAIFTQHAYQSSKMTIVDQIDRFTRLALKAQGQCRATLETLAVIKNPPVFARQANIAHGPQQVNNNAVLSSPSQEGHPLARAENQETEQIELLEAHGERLDIGATSTAGESRQALAPVGTLNRSAHE